MRAGKGVACRRGVSVYVVFYAFEGGKEGARSYEAAVGLSGGLYWRG